MRKLLSVSVLLAAVAFSNVVFAMDPQAGAPAQQKPTFSMVDDRFLSNVEKEVVDAADAMPEAKYTFAPTAGEFKGVRTFAAQAKHIAAVNYVLGAAIIGEKPPVDVGGEDGPAGMTSKADIVKYLKDSFAYAHKSLGTINETNLLEAVKAPWGDQPMTRLTLTNIMISHPFDHYGQMVVYLRMNGVIPPASRGQ